MNEIVGQRQTRRPRLLAIEWLALFSAYVLIAGSVFGLRIYMPDRGAALFSFEHYLLPLAAVIVVGVFWGRGSVDLKAVQLRCRLLASLAFIVFSHFNIKLWAHLINETKWDAQFKAIDLDLPLLQQACLFISAALKSTLFGWDSAYHDVFVGMFVLAIIVAAFDGAAALERLVTLIGAVLVFGGLSYLLAPAFGPFIFDINRSPVQQLMLSFQLSFIDSGGANYSGENFIMPLGAMPSLHVAHGWVLTWVVARMHVWIGVLFALTLIFIGAEAVASKWHYLVDIPVGLAVAALSKCFVRHFLPQAGSAKSMQRA
ncbi:phosphatase PAP2 family protein [Paucibacter sp. APW11]|uniref:Phosphatase PAP2 family protein n=1 Tax=Roseateles aquae TaxID=3077235 RepID=A0ABU3PFC5_9BURK|nr:phosphatase PAP2 family protein [Paucibacter sp. APW11]MDT9001002.1 phosphatase PAP2 family protein [Paucibacter sp. APW11]